MTTTHSRRIAPGEVDAEQAGRALRRINSYAARTISADADIVEIHVETGDDERLVLPRQVFDMLVGILEATEQGKGVQIIPVNAELTTQQAADVLNVSRPFLIKLIEAEKIEYRLVNRHRRIRFDALMEYKARDDAGRRQVADEMTRLGQEFGGD
jgi:excisionase family DNA binding protein